MMIGTLPDCALVEPELDAPLDPIVSDEPPPQAASPATNAAHTADRIK
jgi:hypothetical protein